MVLSLLVKDIDLTMTTENGLIPLRDTVWKAAISAAVNEINSRNLSREIAQKCVYLINALASREAAREADVTFKFKSVDSRLLNIYVVLVVNGMTRRMSDAVLAKLHFLPRLNLKTLWSTTAVQQAACIMSDIFRKLFLCSSTWMHSLPVVVVAAIVETFVRDRQPRKLSWWLVRKNCRKVWQKSIALCGEGIEEPVEKRTRAAFLMLVMVLRAAQKFPNSENIASPDFPVKSIPNDENEVSRRNRIFMSEREVRGLIIVLAEAGMESVANELGAALDFQCAVARSQGAGDNKDITQWCSYSTHEEQVIVTCASSIVMHLSQVVKTLAHTAESLKKNTRFKELVSKLSVDEKDVAYPFMLSMLLVDGSKCLHDSVSVDACRDSISDRISDEGNIKPIPRGQKPGQKRKKYNLAKINDDPDDNSRKKRAKRTDVRTEGYKKSEDRSTTDGSEAIRPKKKKRERAKRKKPMLDGNRPVQAEKSGEGFKNPEAVEVKRSEHISESGGQSSGNDKENQNAVKLNHFEAGGEAVRGKSEQTRISSQAGVTNRNGGRRVSEKVNPHASPRPGPGRRRQAPIVK